jgi:CHAD domain-containing protein
MGEAIMKIKKIIKKLNAHRTMLLQRYDPENIHEIRVSVRRLKSLLKQIDTKESKKNRESLSHLIKTTNTIRDWDTLLISGENILQREDFLKIRPILTDYSNQFRIGIEEQLNDPIWDEVFQESENLLKNSKKESKNVPTLLPENYASELLNRYILAYRKNDTNAWHSLRISVKNLRYQLEYLQTDKSIDPNEHIKSTIDFCKPLQKYLGDWHDSVVHELLIEHLIEQHSHLSVEPSAIFSHWKLLLGLSGYTNINRVKLLFIKHRELFRQDVKV